MYKMMLFILLLVSCSSQKNPLRLGTDAVRVLSEDEKQWLATPTIYYIPQYYKADHLNCLAKEKVDLVDADDNLIVQSCRKVYKSCQMQGTCRVELDNGSRILINVDIINRQGVRTFKKVTSSDCLYGMGDSQDRLTGYKQMCIDPFYSVAADLSIYNLGDVIFMPLLKGVVLPNGEAHSGFVIVRDSGQRIKGVGRFDFFTGYLGLSKNNPFYRMGLGGGVFPEYYVIRGVEADRVRMLRGFPYLKPREFKIVRRD